MKKGKTKLIALVLAASMTIPFCSYADEVLPEEMIVDDFVEDVPAGEQQDLAADAPESLSENIAGLIEDVNTIADEEDVVASQQRIWGTLGDYSEVKSSFSVNGLGDNVVSVNKGDIFDVMVDVEAVLTSDSEGDVVSMESNLSVDKPGLVLLTGIPDVVPIEPSLERAEKQIDTVSAYDTVVTGLIIGGGLDAGTYDVWSSSHGMYYHLRAYALKAGEYTITLVYKITSGKDAGKTVNISKTVKVSDDDFQENVCEHEFQPKVAEWEEEDGTFQRKTVFACTKCGLEKGASFSEQYAQRVKINIPGQAGVSYDLVISNINTGEIIDTITCGESGASVERVLPNGIYTTEVTNLSDTGFDVYTQGGTNGEPFTFAVPCSGEVNVGVIAVVPPAHEHTWIQWKESSRSGNIVTYTRECSSCHKTETKKEAFQETLSTSPAQAVIQKTVSVTQTRTANQTQSVKEELSTNPLQKSTQASSPVMQKQSIVSSPETISAANEKAAPSPVEIKASGLENGTLALKKGKSKKLKAVLNGIKGKVKWSSSKKSVVSVTKNGKIKAKKKGTAYITAKVGKNTYKIKVVVPDTKKKK